jgi:hypothetical protein
MQELRVYRRLTLLEVPLAPRDPRRGARAAELTTREISGCGSDLEAYAHLRPDVAASETRTRLVSRHRCFVAEERGSLISAVWVARGAVRIEYLDCELELHPEDAYVYDAFTVPSRRGQDLASLRPELMKERMRSAGVRRLIAAQLAENRSQARRAQRFAYRPLGVVGWYGIGPWRRPFLREESGLEVPLGIRRVRAVRRPDRRCATAQRCRPNDAATSHRDGLKRVAYDASRRRPEARRRPSPARAAPATTRARSGTPTRAPSSR